MASRIRFVVASLLFALTGAGLEFAQLLRERPWPAALARRAALETTTLWLAATLAFALLLVATSRRRPPRAAFAVAPLAFGVAWLLASLDPQGRLPAHLVLLVGILAVGAAFTLARLAARTSARLPERGALKLAAALAVVVAAADLFLWRHAQPPVGAAAPTPPPNLLFISIDTCRADRLGAYGSRAGLTPNLDALARESVLFEDATCPMPLTGPSHVAMLSGLAPHESGVGRNGVRLAPSVAVLPDRLAGQGYVAAAFVSGLPMHDGALGLASRFHHYDDELDPRAPLADPVRARPFGNVVLRLLRSRLQWREALRRDGRETLARARSWLESMVETEPRTPFFAFVHLYDVHAPYVPHRPGEPPSPLFENLAPAALVALLNDPVQTRHLIDLYDGEVAYVDALLGPFLERVRALGLLERTLVVVTSDHGESLGEHDVWADHVAPHQVEIHVPLLIRLPKGEGGGTRVTGPAQLEDLPATLRDLLGVSIAVPGSSLANSVRTGAIPPRLIFSAGQRDAQNGSAAVAVRDGRWKLLREPAAFDRGSSRLVRPAEHLFDTLADPLETRDLSGGADGPPDLAAWRSALDAFAKTTEAPGDARVDGGLSERLHQLGYAK